MVKTGFAFTADTINIIKAGAENYRAFVKSLESVKENAFIYGYRVGKEPGYTIKERQAAQYLLDKIEDGLTTCKKWKGEQGHDIWALVNTLGYISDVPRGRFSDTSLIYELFAATFIYKWDYENAMLNTAEVMPAMRLYDWFEQLYRAVQADYERYAERNN